MRNRLWRRTAVVAVGVVAAAMLGPGTGARAAATGNGPWIVNAFAGVYQVDRRAPVPPVRLVEIGEDPAASPDGRHIAFVVNQIPWPVPYPNLFVYDRRTAEVRQVTKNTERGTSFAWPSYSPDGTRVAVVQQGRLYTVDMTTGAMTLRLDTGRPISRPAWSPDGRSIAFTMLDEAGLAAIYLLRVGSGRLQKVLTATRIGEWLMDPVWTRTPRGCCSSPRAGPRRGPT